MERVERQKPVVRTPLFAHWPNPYEHHWFKPRSHGSRAACQWCGATKANLIHPQERTE
jgi:hypothetical protein